MNSYSDEELEDLAERFKFSKIVCYLIYELLDCRRKIKSVTDMAKHFGREFDKKSPWEQQVNQLIVQALK